VIEPAVSATAASSSPIEYTWVYTGMLINENKHKA
jgi:hypothetical protein